MKRRELMDISVFWLAVNFVWGAFLSIMLPAEVARFSSSLAQKYQFLGTVAAVGAFAAMVVQPIIGSISDRTSSRIGRRRPYLLVGSAGVAVALLGMAWAPTIVLFAAGFLLLQITLNTANAGYNGIIPDLVPAQQRGVASGYMGLMTMFGTILGVIAATVLLDNRLRVVVYLLTLAIVCTAMLYTVARVHESPIAATGRLSPPAFFRRFWISPRKHPDFGWVFLSRLIVMMGFYTVLNYLQYFLQDVFRLKNYVEQTGIVSLLVLVGALIASLASGWLSDRIDRRRMVFAAGALMGLSVVAFLLTASQRSLVALYAVYVVFGLGYGAYVSVDWAIAVDVLPSREDAAGEMGLWGISSTLPQVIAPLVAGYLVSTLFTHYHATGPAYEWLFGTASLYFLVGATLIWKVTARRTGSDLHEQRSPSPI